MPIIIDTDLTRQLVAEQFPQYSHLAISPVSQSGWDNRTFHLGSELSVRVPSAKHYAGAIAKEQLWLPRLAPHLPLPIPSPVAHGKPSDIFPSTWSIYRWLPGDTAAQTTLQAEPQLAYDLANFLRALHRLDTQGGPTPGPDSASRGGPLTVFDQATRRAIADLGTRINGKRALEIWHMAIASQWQQAPVWVHGDVAAGNLLINDHKLSAVIDWGQLVVGDPACDLVIAWTYFSEEAAAAFAQALALDKDTWARARGWALWKALIVVAEHIDTNAIEAAAAPKVLQRLLEPATKTFSA